MGVRLVAGAVHGQRFIPAVDVLFDRRQLRLVVPVVETRHNPDRGDQLLNQLRFLRRRRAAFFEFVGQLAPKWFSPVCGNCARR